MMIRGQRACCYIYTLILGVGLGACSTQIPTLEESAKQSHIPLKFQNLSQNLTKEEGAGGILESSVALEAALDSENALDSEKNSDSKMPFALKQFSAIFNEPTLHSLLLTALENNTNVLSMLSRIKQAQSQAKISTSNMLPSVNAGLNSSYIDRRTLSQTTAIRPGANSINANLSLSWELDLFGKFNALRQSSKKDYAAAQSNLAYAQISLISEVATLYFTLRDNAAQIAAAQLALDNLNAMAHLISTRYKLGLVDINTLKSSIASQNAQKNTLESLRYTYEQNKNALLVLLNITQDELDLKVDFSQAWELPTLQTLSVPNLPAQVLLSRPDIQSNLYALHSQLYKETNAKAARLPSISLSGSVGEILYSSSGAGSLIFQIANSITAPLLNRTSLKQNHLIQKELSKEAFYTLQNSINIALGEIENALFDTNSKQRQVQNNTLAFEIAKMAHHDDLMRLERGLLDQNDFLTNHNSFLSLQTQLFSSQVSQILATITLYKALGGQISSTQISSINDEISLDSEISESSQKSPQKSAQEFDKGTNKELDEVLDKKESATQNLENKDLYQN